VKKVYDVTLNELKARKVFTKDQKELEEKKGHLVFVWDNFKLGFPWDKYFFCEKYLGSAFTAETNYILYGTNNGPPLLIHDMIKNKDREKFYSRVSGDVFYTDWRKIAQLDAIMANNFDFKRVERYVALRDQTSPFVDQSRKVTAKAWMYIATEKYLSSMQQVEPTIRYMREEGFVYEWPKYAANEPSH